MKRNTVSMDDMAQSMKKTNKQKKNSPKIDPCGTPYLMSEKENKI